MGKVRLLKETHATSVQESIILGTDGAVDEGTGAFQGKGPMKETCGRLKPSDGARGGLDRGMRWAHGRRCVPRRRDSAHLRHEFVSPPQPVPAVLCRTPATLWTCHTRRQAQGHSRPPGNRRAQAFAREEACARRSTRSPCCSGAWRVAPQRSPRAAPPSAVCRCTRRIPPPLQRVCACASRVLRATALETTIPAHTSVRKMGFCTFLV